MAKKHVTLSIDKKIYDKYLAHCKENGIILSKKIELFIKKELEVIKK